jgi:hypothetical protein
MDRINSKQGIAKLFIVEHDLANGRAQAAISAVYSFQRLEASLRAWRYDFAVS